MTNGKWLILLFVAMLVVAGLFGAWQLFQQNGDSDASSEPPWFADVTDTVGLLFTHDAGPVDDNKYFMPQQVGSGAAIFDFNNDGMPDIYLLQNGGPKSSSTNRLFRQMSDGTFQDVSEGSGLAINGHNMGVAIGDVNNDGWLDVLVTQYNGLKLFLNNGNGTFRDASTEVGLSSPFWNTSAAFFDYDRDGWLDLVVVCYVENDETWPCKGPTKPRDYCAPRVFKGRVSRLFHNLGGSVDKGAVRFEEVTVKSGLGRVPGPGLGVLCADFDGDGWPDILVANDGEANRLWINRHDGTFVEEATKRGLAVDAAGNPAANMGIAFGDVDGDGLMDVFITHLAEETHTLWRQGPRGLYLDRTLASGLLQSKWRGTGFGTVFGDFTNAGHLDLALVNGAVAAHARPTDSALGPFWTYYGQRNQLFANDGRGRFRDVSLANAAFCGKMNVARGLAYGDLDRDGGLDLLVTTIAGRARLFRNVAPRRGHWLSIRAVDPKLKRDALGTLIQVQAGQRSWRRWLHPAASYLCSNELRAHFGLGAATRVDRIEVTWPNGDREVFPGGPVDQRIELRKGSGRPVSGEGAKGRSHSPQQDRTGGP